MAGPSSAEGRWCEFPQATTSARRRNNSGHDAAHGVTIDGRLVAKSPPFPLTDPRQFGILQSGPGCGNRMQFEGAPGGVFIVYSTPNCRRCDGVAADRGRSFRLSFAGGGRSGRSCVRQLRRRGRDRGLALAARAVEGRAVAHPHRRGEAARGRAFADRARWQRRGQIARAARRAAVFLVRRGRLAGRGDVACDARARPRAGRLRHDHARHRRERRQAAGAARGGGQHLAAAQCMEPRDGKPVFGMDREAVRCAARRGAVVEGVA